MKYLTKEYWNGRNAIKYRNIVSIGDEEK